MDYCIDDSEGIGSTSIPFVLDGKPALQFPVAASVGDIPAGGKSEATLSLCFAPATPEPIMFAGVLSRSSGTTTGRYAVLLT